MLANPNSGLLLHSPNPSVLSRPLLGFFAGFPSSTPARNSLSPSSSTSFLSHPRPWIISNTFIGVPTNISTGWVDFATSNSPKGPEEVSENSEDILLAVKSRRVVLFWLAWLAQSTRSFASWRRDLAKPESWRESSWVGARMSPRGLYGLLLRSELGGRDEDISSVSLRFCRRGRR